MKTKKNYESIDEIICDYLDKKQANVRRQRAKESYWSASGLGKCKRYQYFIRKETEATNNTPYKWKNNAEDGHASHIWRQAAIKLMVKESWFEGEIVDKEACFKGHYDIVVRLNDGLALCDIKTQNNKRFRKRALLPDKIDPLHKRQLGAYFLFLKKSQFPDLANARIYYINRDTGEREEIIVEFDDEYLADIKNEIKYLNNCWLKDMLPQREVSMNCASFCEFYDTCYNSRRFSSEIHEKSQRENSGVPQLPALRKQKVSSNR